jgi:hypothetical protein
MAATTDLTLPISLGLTLAVERNLSTFDWLRQLNVPFVKSSGFVPLIENCNSLLESTTRISFETPSAIVPLRYVVMSAALLMSLIRLPSSSI